jgi:hypothetical protein
LGFPYPTTKASCQVLPGGLEKIPHILGIFLKYYSLYAIFDSSKNKFLSFTLIYSDPSKAISYQNPASAGCTSKLNVDHLFQDEQVDAVLNKP